MSNRAKSLLKCIHVQDGEDAITKINRTDEGLFVVSLFKAAQDLVHNARQARLKELGTVWLQFLEN